MCLIGKPNIHASFALITSGKAMPVIELERDAHGNLVNLNYHEDRFIRDVNKLIKNKPTEFNAWAEEFLRCKSEYWLSELLKRIGVK
jgi:hypothetical protein